MADIAIQPVWQVLDGNGNPYPGAKATFYVSGTTTPLTVYTDVGLTVAHAVPVVANGNGVLPAIYFGGTAAKVVLTTSTGAAIGTVDPLPRSSATATGAAQISFAATAELPFLNVQDAIEGVQDNLDGSSSVYSKLLLAETTASAWLTRLDPSLNSLAGLSLVAGDVLYATAADTLQRLGIGTAGQLLRVNSGATAPEWAAHLTLSTSVATTSGTSIDFTTGIPASATRVTVMLAGVSTNGTANLLVQLGNGSFVTTGYTSSAHTSTNAPQSSTAGMLLTGGVSAALAYSPILTLIRITGNQWLGGLSGHAGANGALYGGGLISLGGALDRIRLTTTNGTDTFDAGAVNILVE
jgi:hypothetical protein